MAESTGSDGHPLPIGHPPVSPTASSDSGETEASASSVLESQIVTGIAAVSLETASGPSSSVQSVDELAKTIGSTLAVNAVPPDADPGDVVRQIESEVKTLQSVDLDAQKAGLKRVSRMLTPFAHCLALKVCQEVASHEKLCAQLQEFVDKYPVDLQFVKDYAVLVALMIYTYSTCSDVKAVADAMAVAPNNSQPSSSSSFGDVIQEAKKALQSFQSAYDTVLAWIKAENTRERLSCVCEKLVSDFEVVKDLLGRCRSVKENVVSSVLSELQELSSGIDDGQFARICELLRQTTFRVTLIKTSRVGKNASQSILFTHSRLETDDEWGERVVHWVLYDTGYPEDEGNILKALRDLHCISEEQFEHCNLENAYAKLADKPKNGIIIISHLHKDHVNNLFDLEGQTDPKSLPASVAGVSTKERRGTVSMVKRVPKKSLLRSLARDVYSSLDYCHPRTCADGVYFLTEYPINDLGPFSFKVLSANPALNTSTYDLVPAGEDNSSLIISMTVDGVKQDGKAMKVLLPGDYKNKTFKLAPGVCNESSLGLFTPHNGVPYDVFVMSHHGSLLSRSLMDKYTGSGEKKVSRPLFIAANCSLTDSDHKVNVESTAIGFWFFETLNHLTNLKSFDVLTSDVVLNSMKVGELRRLKKEKEKDVVVPHVFSPIDPQKLQSRPESFDDCELCMFRGSEREAICGLIHGVWSVMPPKAKERLLLSELEKLSSRSYILSAMKSITSEARDFLVGNAKTIVGEFNDRIKCLKDILALEELAKMIEPKARELTDPSQSKVVCNDFVATVTTLKGEYDKFGEENPVPKCMRGSNTYSVKRGFIANYNNFIGKLNEICKKFSDFIEKFGVPDNFELLKSVLLNNAGEGDGAFDRRVFFVDNDDRTTLQWANGWSRLSIGTED